MNAANTLAADSIVYAGEFIFENGQLGKYLFEGGYATFAGGQPAYHYYTRDHLGNNRTVVSHGGSLEQVNHYYPFGAVYSDAGTNDALQRYKYNGKELDRMHGMNLYDYGTRSYDPLLCRFTQIDPMAEKYYDVNPYLYCHNSPTNRVDHNGKDDYYSIKGEFLFRDSKETDNIFIRDEFLYNLKTITGAEWITPDVPIEKSSITAEALSNLFTDILAKMEDVDIRNLHNSKVSVTILSESNDNLSIRIVDLSNDANNNDKCLADIGTDNIGKQILTAYVFPQGTEERKLLNTVSNIQNLLGAHEYLGHFKHNWHGEASHKKVVPFQRFHDSWKRTTEQFKKYNYEVYPK